MIGQNCAENVSWYLHWTLAQICFIVYTIHFTHVSIGKESFYVNENDLRFFSRDCRFCLILIIEIQPCCHLVGYHTYRIISDKLYKNKDKLTGDSVRGPQIWITEIEYLLSKSVLTCSDLTTGS